MKKRQKQIIRKLYKQTLPFRSSPPFDTQLINIEFCSSCNLRCCWCTLDHQKPKTLMSEEILAKCMDEIVAGHRFFYLERIDLHNGGETLLHPHLDKLLAIIASRKSKLLYATVNLLTNATPLSELKSRQILESGAIDAIRFSVDGGTREAFEQIRKGAHWEVLRKNIERFLVMNQGQINSGVICVIPQDKPLSMDWMEPEFRMLLEKVDFVELRHPHNFDGSKDLGLSFSSENPFVGKTCKFLLKQLVILPNGDVTVCCNDLNSRGVLGNVKIQSLSEIYHSQKRAEMLSLFRSGEKHQIDLCKNCAGVYEASDYIQDQSNHLIVN